VLAHLLAELCAVLLLLQVAYPFMHLAFQLGDFNSLLQGRTVGAELLGASTLGKWACIRV
jgi:hypothetical protein